MDISRFERRPRAHVETLDASEVVSGNLHEWRSLRDLRIKADIAAAVEAHANFNSFGIAGEAVEDDSRPVPPMVAHRESQKAVDPAPAIGERWLRFFSSIQRPNHPMQFDTKIAIAIRTDLEPWQKLNVASFLAGGIAAAFLECIGENYQDGSGTQYLSLIGQPILIYGADRAALSRALERTLARNVTSAVYTEDMFRNTHDAANREVVRAVIRADLNLVGLAMRAERKVVDKIVDGLKFHG
jgi:hypothetical protein